MRCKTARLALRSWARCAPSGNVAHIAREGVGVLEEQRLLGEEQRATARPPTSARLQEAGELECEVLGLGPVIAEDDSELAALDARVDLALRQVDARRGVMGTLGRQLVELRVEGESEVAVVLWLEPTSLRSCVTSSASSDA